MFQKILFSTAAFAVLLSVHAQQKDNEKPVRMKLQNLRADMVDTDTAGYRQNILQVPEEINIFFKETEPYDCILFTMEQRPEFPGGLKAMLKFLSKNLTYPKAADKAKVQGKVFVSFTVTKTG